MTVTEFKKKIGAKKYAEIAAYAKQLADEGKSPDKAAAAIKARFRGIAIPSPVFPNILYPCYQE